MYTFRNNNNWDKNLYMDSEISRGVSMTVPDQSLTVREIIDRFTRGQSLDGIYHEPYGEEDPDFSDLDPTQDPAFDINDAHRIKAEIEERQNSRKKQAVQTTLDQAIEDASKEREAQTKVERSE